MARPPGVLVGLLVTRRADVDDPLALLARDLGPVVRVGGVGQVLVLLVLLVDRRRGGRRSGCRCSPPASSRLMASFLARRTMFSIIAPGREVLEVQDLLVAVLVGDLEEPVVARRRGTSRRRCVSIIGPHRLVAVAAAEAADLGLEQRQVGGEVVGEDLRGRASALGRSILIFTSRRPGRRMAGSIRSSRFGGADHDDVLQRLDAVDLGQQLRHDRRLHVGADARCRGCGTSSPSRRRTR